MFTGIVVEQGVVTACRRSPNGAVLKIESKRLLPNLRIGDSVSVNGACLTLVEKERDEFVVEVTPETLRLTNLEHVQVGDPVNLEAAARLSDFLSGHLVQGHVDQTGRLLSIRPEGNSRILRFRAANEVHQHCSLKGSIAVNGVSLTISGMGEGWFEVALIPHTMKVTNLGRLQVGDQVNLEADVISKYVKLHVKRLMVLAGAFLLLSVPPLLGEGLSLGEKSVLVYREKNGDITTELVVRLARLRPDLVLEWESVSNQGTVHVFRKALATSRNFTLRQLFEVGVDMESSERITVLLSDFLFSELQNQSAFKVVVNRTPVKWEVVGEETFLLELDDQSTAFPGIRVKDNRRGSWLFLNDAGAPLLLEYVTPYFQQQLVSVTSKGELGLRWIRKKPPIK